MCGIYAFTVLFSKFQQCKKNAPQELLVLMKRFNCVQQIAIQRIILRIEPFIEPNFPREIRKDTRAATPTAVKTDPKISGDRFTNNPSDTFVPECV